MHCFFHRAVGLAGNNEAIFCKTDIQTLTTAMQRQIHVARLIGCAVANGNGAFELGDCVDECIE
jgi:hypothetical protein